MMLLTFAGEFNLLHVLHALILWLTLKCIAVIFTARLVMQKQLFCCWNAFTCLIFQFERKFTTVLFILHCQILLYTFFGFVYSLCIFFSYCASLIYLHIRMFIYHFVFSGYKLHSVHQAKCEDGGPRIWRRCYFITAAVFRHDLSSRTDAAGLPISCAIPWPLHNV